MTTIPAPASPPLELVCPAGSLPALKADVDNGADCVYLGFRDATNARNFAGLNLSEDAIAEGIRYAHARDRKVFLALNTCPKPGAHDIWRNALDRAATHGIDAVILADPGLMEYAARVHPALRLHLSVQGSATDIDAIAFYQRHFDRYADGEQAGYPTLCKGRFDVDGETYYAIEEPASLNTLDILPKLAAAGARAVEIEGRQRSPACVAQVTRAWRAAIDMCLDGRQRYGVRRDWMALLDNVAEGGQHTLGAYHRAWKRRRTC